MINHQIHKYLERTINHLISVLCNSILILVHSYNVDTLEKVKNIIP